MIGLFGFEDYRNVLEQIDEIDSLQWKIDTKEINLDIAIKEIVIKNKGKTAGLKFVGEEEL